MSYNKNTEMWEGYIYKITNNINDKIYIGQTIVSCKKRWYQHKNYSKNNKNSMPIAKALNKYGSENFKFEELIIVESDTKSELKEQLNYLEKLMIYANNSLINQNGYNVRKGGQNEGIIGIQIDAYDIDGNFLNSFDSILEAARFFDIPDLSIRLIISGKQFNYKNKYVFRFKGEPFNSRPCKNPNTNYIIYQFDTYGNLLNSYPNVSSASKSIGCNLHSYIIDDPHLLGGGYWWSYNKTFNYEGSSISKKIDVYDINGNFIETLGSISDTSKKYNVKNVGKICNGEGISGNNFIFRYHGERFDKYKTSPTPTYNRKKVNQYTKNNVFVMTWNSITEATNYFTDSGSTAIYMCCAHKKSYNTAFKYKWFYVDDESQPDKTKIYNMEKNVNE